MSKIEIITDPTTDIVDIDLERADVVTVIHKGDAGEIKELLDNWKKDDVKPIYCHYYTDDKIYTIGLKVINL